MDWIHKDWIVEDEEFAPKRRVDNKISWQMSHIIGSFHSNKMSRVVEYHSLNECLFYFLLELDTSTARYYVQPVDISVPFIDKQGNKKSWSHVPDVLVLIHIERENLSYNFDDEFDKSHSTHSSLLVTTKTEKSGFGFIIPVKCRFIK